MNIFHKIIVWPNLRQSYIESQAHIFKTSQGSIYGQLKIENSFRKKISIGLIEYCQNPTNNPKQLKTTFIGVVL